MRYLYSGLTGEQISVSFSQVQLTIKDLNIWSKIRFIHELLDKVLLTSIFEGRSRDGENLVRYLDCIGLGASTFLKERNT